MTLKFKTETGDVLNVTITNFLPENYGWESHIVHAVFNSYRYFLTKEEAIADLKATVEKLSMKGEWVE